MWQIQFFFYKYPIYTNVLIYLTTRHVTGTVFKYNTLDSLPCLMIHKGAFQMFWFEVCGEIRSPEWYLFKRPTFSSYILENKQTHIPGMALSDTYLWSCHDTVPLLIVRTKAVVNSARWTVGDPQVVPVSGLCLPPGGHLHQRITALWLLDSRKGKPLSVFPFYPVRVAFSTGGVRWGDFPCWLAFVDVVSSGSDCVQCQNVWAVWE